MNRIQVLDQTTIDRIAAGEVVERPASVVKELAENAIDARASRITIEIREGGISMLRITDNGDGIAASEVPLAFLRHATSKIREASDLNELSSLGFRGEALSSIAAVSRVEMITKRREEIAAFRYLIEGGREKIAEEIGAPDGTTIIVRDLFYNTPARAKFLKTPMTEAAHVGSVVEQLILSNPSISFTYIDRGQTKLHSSGNGSLKDAIFQIYGRHLTQETIPVDFSEEGIRIEGAIGKPSLSRGNRNYENYYINGRYTKSRVIARAIEDGYATKLMQHQYPFTCLVISIDRNAVDVNVHPTKMEVRFSDEKKVYDAVRGAVSSTLANLDMILHPEILERISRGDTEESKKGKGIRPPEPFEVRAADAGREIHRAEDETGKQEPSAVSAADEKKDRSPAEGREEKREFLSVPAADAGRNPGMVREETFPNPANPAASAKGRYEQMSFVPAFADEEARPFRRFVGQVFKTYWIVEYDEEMYLFDQHAAHERVLYEQFMRAYEDRSITSEVLSPPMIVTLSAKEAGMLEGNRTAFTSLGFEIEPFGERDFAVRAVPYFLGTMGSAELFLDFLDQLEATPDFSDMKTYIRKVATEACKAAVKGGERLSEAEAEELLADLLRCEDPYHCPHGRPTLISYKKTDLEKRFKRII